MPLLRYAQLDITCVNAVESAVKIDLLQIMSLTLLI